jgi:hypothetical protein
MEEKPMMDEFVALYIGMQGNKGLEQKFRESLGVSDLSMLTPAADIPGRGSLPTWQIRRVWSVCDSQPLGLF